LGELYLSASFHCNDTANFRKSKISGFCQLLFPGWAEVAEFIPMIIGTPTGFGSPIGHQNFFTEGWELTIACSFPIPKKKRVLLVEFQAEILFIPIAVKCSEYVILSRW